MEGLTDASFENVRSLEVYTAPSEDAYRVDGAQVTTDATPIIYGVEGEWVLVSYGIGDGSRGRMGYIRNTTLANPENVAPLNLSRIPATLTKDADATDDPLNAHTALTSLKAGDEVTVLGFLGSEWVYVEFSLDGKTCRLFVPQSALMEE